jgi:hypothetical protein
MSPHRDERGRYLPRPVITYFGTMAEFDANRRRRVLDQAVRNATNPLGRALADSGFLSHLLGAIRAEFARLWAEQ